jgi:hypothetical protein
MDIEQLFGLGFDVDRSFGGRLLAGREAFSGSRKSGRRSFLGSQGRLAGGIRGLLRDRDWLQKMGRRFLWFERRGCTAYAHHP